MYNTNHVIFFVKEMNKKHGNTCIIEDTFMKKKTTTTQIDKHFFE